MDEKEKQQEPPVRKKKRLTRGQRIAVTAVCAVLGLVLLAGIFGMIYVKVLLGQLRRPGSNEPYFLPTGELTTEPTEAIPEGFTGPILRGEDVTLPTDAAEMIVSDGLINFLLVGQDARAGQGIQRADSTILCTIDPNGKTITFTSFQRDMYVPIPGYASTKISFAFRYGAYFGDHSYKDAFALMNETLAYNFGVQVDGNIAVDFESFKALIDQLGGLDITLTDREADYLNDHGCSVHAGENHMDGATALEYSRIRYIDSDFARNNRQRIVMNTIVEKVKRMDILQINDLLMTALPCIWTDISDADIWSYALKLLPLLPELEVKSAQIPAEGTYYLSMVDGRSVVIIDFDANLAVLKEILSEKSAETTSD